MTPTTNPARSQPNVSFTSTCSDHKQSASIVVNDTLRPGGRQLCRGRFSRRGALHDARAATSPAGTTPYAGDMLRQFSATLEFRTSGRGLVEITEAVRRWFEPLGVRCGVLTLFVRHTS